MRIFLLLILSSLVPNDAMSSESMKMSARLVSLEKIVQQQQLTINQHQLELEALRSQLSSQTSQSSQLYLSVSICTPCIPRHIHSLKDVISSMKEQSMLPKEIIVSLSETKREDGIELQRSITEEYFSGQAPNSQPWPVLKIVTTEEKKTHAENNNIAASYATGDIVSWFDADDVVHPKRVEMIERAFRTLKVNMVLHQLQIFDALYVGTTSEQFFDNQPWAVSGQLTLSPVPHNQTTEWLSLLEQTYSASAFQEQGDGGGSLEVLMGSSLYDLYAATEGGFNSVTSVEGKMRMHNGHVSVRKHVFNEVQWEDMVTDSVAQVFGEDVRFVKTVLLKFGRTDKTAAFLPAALSKYMPSWGPSKRCVLGPYVLYDCHVGVDPTTGKPTLDFNGYDTAFCAQGQPGYYADENNWSLGITCVLEEERETVAPGLRYIDPRMFSTNEKVAALQQQVYEDVGFTPPAPV